jgi:hypothetical protein
MVTAIFLLSLVAMTLTALSAELFVQASRTRTLGEDAQLRQLLLAGTTFAQSHLDSSSIAPMTISLPGALQRQSAVLTIKIRPGNSSSEKIAEIEASLPRNRLSQQLHFSRDEDHWRMTEATLGD